MLQYIVIAAFVLLVSPVVLWAVWQHRRHNVCGGE